MNFFSGTRKLFIPLRPCWLWLCLCVSGMMCSTVCAEQDASDTDKAVTATMLEKLDVGLQRRWLGTPQPQRIPALSKAVPTNDTDRLDILIHLKQQTTKQGLGMFGTHAQARVVAQQAWVARLRTDADQQQASLRAWLRERGITFQTFWVANTISAQVPRAWLPALAARADVA